MHCPLLQLSLPHASVPARDRCMHNIPSLAFSKAPIGAQNISVTTLWQVIIHQDKVYLSHGAERARLIPTYHALIQRVRLRVKLPDMVIPLNPGQISYALHDICTRQHERNALLQYSKEKYHARRQWEKPYLMRANIDRIMWI